MEQVQLPGNTDALFSAVGEVYTWLAFQCSADDPIASGTVLP
ncbi:MULTISPECIES: hypothetical protein [unclassified Moorena]|nr:MULTISPECIES: hypothetical protein [unclassified Moorena]